MALEVLVADDEECAAQALARLIAREGCAVATAEDGEAAFAALKACPPDIAFLDMDLPRRDGHELAFAIRADPALAHARIVLMSTRARPVDGEKARALGADAVLVKPFGADAVRATLAALARAPEAVA